jgi:hypothetical protein
MSPIPRQGDHEAGHAVLSPHSDLNFTRKDSGLALGAKSGGGK